MEADQFLCVRCARHMMTCCQTCEIHVTSGDVGRIEAHTARRDFHEYQAPVNSVYEDHDDDPAWQVGVFRPDGTRRVLKRQENGDCLFLGAQGCVLPLEVRPLVCRIYPFDYDAAGLKPDDELAPGCPLELLKPGQGLIEALEMNRADAQRWHAQLYAEIAKNHEQEGDVDQRRTESSGGVACASA